MSDISNLNFSPSYFWSCLTLKEECPFISNNDLKMYYFGLLIVCLYAAFFLIILADLKFYWSLDKFQRQIDYYTNFVRKKVRNVRINQRRLLTTQERTEKQLKRSQHCKHIVTALRAALSADDPRRLSILNDNDDLKESPYSGTWCGNQSVDEL